MKRYDLVFRALTVTNRMVKVNLTNFLNRNDLFESNINKTTVKVVKGKNITIIYKDILLNLNDKRDKITLVKNILESLNLKNITLKTSDKISFFYIESEDKVYSSYKNSFKTIKNRIYSPSVWSGFGKRFYSTDSSVKYKFINKNYPLILGFIDFETTINKFIESNKRLFGKYNSNLVQVENKDYIF